MIMKIHLNAYRPHPIISESDRPSDWRYQLMELKDDLLLSNINTLSREQLVEWLAWNDVHGLFSDEDCIAEGLTPLSLEQARMCVYAVIMRNHADWDGFMGDICLRDLELAVATE